MTGWIDVAGWALVHFAWQGTIIGLAAAAVLRIMAGLSAQSRYIAGCATLAAMLAAPILTAWAIAVPPTGARAATEATTSDTASRSATTMPDLRAETPAARSAAGAPAVPAPAPAFGDWQQVVVVCWLTGVALLLIRLVGGWWRVRRLHAAARSARPSAWTSAADRIARVLRIRRDVRVVDWPSIDTPRVIGWLRPVIVLPVAALSNLTPAQVDAILAHELAHVRRHDFVVNLLQTLVETLLFYHPAVWWLSGRVRAEREHCCDELAVILCGDALSYAEALTELEAWRTSATSLAVAATGGSLLERVRRVLGAPAPVAPRLIGITSLAVPAIVLLLAIVGATSAVRARTVQPAEQERGSSEPPSTDAQAWSVVFNHSTSEMRFIGFTGRQLIRFAYQIPQVRVLGGPRWLDQETLEFSVDLDAPPAAHETPSIVRRLLEDRLRLQVHVETRDVPVYLLVVSSLDGAPGPNIRPSTTDCFDMDAWIAAGQPPGDVRRRDDGRPVCGSESTDSSVLRKSFVAITMEQLAERLEGYSELAMVQGQPRPRRRDVIDGTGLVGGFDVHIDTFRPAAALMDRYPILKALFEPLGMPSLPTALERQLGLTLEDAVAPQEVIVIDRAERPTG